MPTARVSLQTRRVSTRRRRTSHRQGPRAPTALVDRMVVAASLMVAAYTDRLMRALEPLLQARYGLKRDSARADAAPSLDEVFEQVREGELSRAFLERMFHQVDNQAANDLQRVVPVPLADVLPDAARMQSAWVEKNTELIRLEERARQEVRAIIEAPIVEGVRVEEIRARIQERMGVVQSRAELIARDQTLKVYGQIQEARQTDAGIEEYTWSTSDDERVRKRHTELEGTTQRWDSPPVVDPRTGRREHPGGDFQCRCAAIPILPTGEEAPISETRPSRRAPANDVPPLPPEERAMAAPLPPAPRPPPLQTRSLPAPSLPPPPPFAKPAAKPAPALPPPVLAPPVLLPGTLEGPVSRKVVAELVESIASGKSLRELGALETGLREASLAAIRSDPAFVLTGALASDPLGVAGLPTFVLEGKRVYLANGRHRLTVARALGVLYIQAVIERRSARTGAVKWRYVGKVRA